jgi:hypothetical protein
VHHHVSQSVLRRQYPGIIALIVSIIEQTAFSKGLLMLTAAYVLNITC